MVAVLLGCGLRRSELAAVQVADIQRHEEHWVFADLIGEGGHIGTVPIPDWVAAAVHALGCLNADVSEQERLIQADFLDRIWLTLREAVPAAS